MATFLIETYLSRERASEVDAAAARLASVIAAASSEPSAGGAGSGARIRHVRSYFVADDETCFHLLEAPSADVAAEIASRAGLTPDRVVAASASGEQAGPHDSS